MQTSTIPDNVEIEIVLHEEYEDPAGFFASDDDEADRKMVRDIKRRLNLGQPWAWCCVEVRAIVRDGLPGLGEIVASGSDFLGGCSYRNEADFKHPDGYYPQMVEEAIDRLRTALKRIAKRGTLAAELLEETFPA